MSSTRQLAAIMFTDIVGYTALMGRDEEKAFALLRKNREIQKPLIRQFHGTWIKELGDGVLASFHTVTDAVICSAAIHNACEGVDGLKLRIGIHLGEVVFENNDVFGDGVNIASRLQALAPIGGTFVSESVYKNVSNKKEIVAEFVREETLKNVSDPVKIYEVKLELPLPYEPLHNRNLKNKIISSPARRKGSILIIAALMVAGFLAFYFLYTGKNQSNASVKNMLLEKSIAVIPFADISPDRDQGYFTDGMMIEILDHLFKIKDLRITPRNSTLKYKDSPKSLKEIAEELGVANIIEGSVRKFGNQVKISVGLYGSQREEYLWQHSYEEDISDISRIFLVQSDAAKKIATALQSEITSNAKTRIESFPTMNREAYDFYLRGRDATGRFWGDGDTNHIKSAAVHYHRAIALDPGFSDAYTGLGETYWMLAQYVRPDFWMQSRNYLERAIGLDSLNGWAYSELAVVQHNWYWNKTAALRSLQKANELEPGNGQIHHHYFWYFIKTHDCQGAVKELEILKSIDPGDYFANEVLVKMCLGKTDALKELQPPPGLGIVTIWSEFNRLLILGRSDDALKFLDQNEAFTRDIRFFLAMKGMAFAMAGRFKEARAIINQLDELSRKQYVPATYLAYIYAGLSEEDKVYYYLEKALKEREVDLHHLWYYAIFYTKKDDPKLQEIVRRSWIPLEE